MTRRGELHHLEIWRDDATASDGPWAWLLTALGYERDGGWATGCRYRLGGAYVVLESGPDHRRGPGDRLATGANHVAFRGGSRAEVDALTLEAGRHGWALLFAERHPFAGGPGHYATFLADDLGLEVELVADEVAGDIADDVAVTVADGR